MKTMDPFIADAYNRNQLVYSQIPIVISILLLISDGPISSYASYLLLRYCGRYFNYG